MCFYVGLYLKKKNNYFMWKENKDQSSDVDPT